MNTTKEQDKLIAEAGLLMKKAFPECNGQFCFNMSKKHDNVNFNITGDWKFSGILDPKKVLS